LDLTAEPLGLGREPDAGVGKLRAWVADARAREMV
jgi:hypothetical protein